MEDLLASCFKRVEGALATFIDSIAKYNPNPALAHDLVAADTELNQGLDQLTTHQLNYARIISLRSTSNALDHQIRETLEHLTSVRKDVISTPSTKHAPNKNPVSYADLLAYARRISKFTSPPSYRDPVVNIDTTDASVKKYDEVLNPMSDDNNKPDRVGFVSGQEQQTETNKSIAVSTPAPSAENVPTSQSTITTNNNNWFDYLNPRTDKLWTPWPSEETIRRGALASIQILVHQGIDLATFDPEKGAELEAERKRVVEEEDRQREEQRLKFDEEQNLQQRERQSITSGSVSEQKDPPIPPQSKVFQLETFDEDDDDDDDDDED